MDEFKKSVRNFFAMGLAVFGIPYYLYLGAFGLLFPVIGLTLAYMELRYSLAHEYTARESEARKTLYLCGGASVMIFILMIMGVKF